MKTLSSLLVFCLLFNLSSTAQLTVMKGKKEFYNGTESTLTAYLDQNFYNLNPIEGIWVFTKIEYNDAGNVVSEDDNFARSGIVRDANSPRRDFIEFALEYPAYTTNKVIYNITKAGASGAYTCEGVGWLASNTSYTYNQEHDAIYRAGTPLVGSSAVTIGVRQYPKSAPKNVTGGTYAANTGNAAQTARGSATRKVTDPRGWQPIVDWDNHIFPAYLLSMSTINQSSFSPDPDYIGDPISVLGIMIVSPGNNAKVHISIDATKYSRPVDVEYTLPVQGVQYSVYPKVSWDYDLLRGLKQSTPLDFTYRVVVNEKTFPPEYVTTTLRSINDCPLYVSDYHGEMQDLKLLFAAYVNEENPLVDQMLGEALKLKTVNEFMGYQGKAEDVVMQVYAIWRLLQEKGIKYSSITTSAHTTDDKVFSQRIRTFEDAMNTRQANCVDGTVVFSSFLRAIGIHPILVTIPGHCFLGFYLDEEKTKPLFLETTMLGMTDLSQYSGVKNNQSITFNNKAMSDKDEVSWKAYIAALNEGQAKYDKAMQEVSQDAKLAPYYQTIDVGEARKFGIKPIGH